MASSQFEDDDLRLALALQAQEEAQLAALDPQLAAQVLNSLGGAGVVPGRGIPAVNQSSGVVPPRGADAVVATNRSVGDLPQPSGRANRFPFPAVRSGEVDADGVADEFHSP